MKVFWKNMNGNLCVPLFIKRVRHLKSRPPWPEAVRMIASLGGFLGRKGGGEPGVKTIWLGLRRLHDISQTWKLSHQISSPIEPP
ncbi:hypothetical protein B5D77_07675 [Microcystis sp. MC19]|uniref:IS4 family transposase n=1 Tax=Microcystis sp. MC19 TaxID=1967666 RepID=UPI000D20EA03|nr:hypothetical protein B5D77_07675 [Microcystis sp. MC19]